MRKGLRAKARLRKGLKDARHNSRRFYARIYRETELRRQWLVYWRRQHRQKIVVALLLASFVVALIGYRRFSYAIETFVALPDILNSLRTLFVTLGGALIGATAIGFSVVMLAVQLNFARVPHGLFQRVTSDWKLIGSFVTTFLIAGLVTAFSLIPDKSWAALAVIGTFYAAIAILVLFIYAYRRALTLINPVSQLRLLYRDAERDLELWKRRAQRLAPLLEQQNRGHKESRSEHDTARLLFFQANSQWTNESRRAVRYAVNFVRRFSAENDYETANEALRTIIAINGKYVEAKGKTFFATNPIFDIALARDAFFQETLEHLRLLSQSALTRRDEDQVRQIFATFTGLVGVYSTIDYSNEYEREKHDATMAAGYLAGAVESVAPHNLPDVVMEGLRQLGRSAAVLIASDPDSAAIAVQKIGQLAATGAVRENYRAVTVTGMEQLSDLTKRVILAKSDDIGFIVKEIRGQIARVTKLFVGLVATDALISAHSGYLAPYYSLTKTDTFGNWFSQVANELRAANKDDGDKAKIIRHIKEWADQIYRSEKEVFLAAIEKRSHFAFDVIHWIARVSTALAQIAQSPAADSYTAKEIERSAIWLLSVLDWIPDDRTAVRYIEYLGVTDQLFEVATDAERLGSSELGRTARDLLLGWSLKVGKDQPYSLENALRALVVASFFGDELGNVASLRAGIPKALAATPLEQSVLDNAARELRTKAASFRPRDFPTSRLDLAMQKVDTKKMQDLLVDVANLISPGTKTEKVRIDI